MGNQELKGRLRKLRAVQAGWAFGVPVDGQEQWLDEVAAAVAGPVFAAIDEHGQLADYTGFGLWMVAVWLPEGREGEAVAALASHGLVVYRMWHPDGSGVAGG